MVTKGGTKRIKDAVGNVTLMTTKGEWADAEVKHFGKQRLYKVVLGFGIAEKVIYATAEHSWRVAKRVYNDRVHDKIKVDTKDLKTGDRLWQVYGYGISRTSVCPFGVQQGLVYGDGGVARSKCRLRLCGQKGELIRYFPLVKTRKVDNDIEILNLPIHFKQKPSLDYDRSFLLGWLAGYFAADGCVSKKGQVSLSSADKQALQFVKDVAYLIGVGVNSIRSTERVSNLTKEKETLYIVTFDKAILTSSFFLQSKHRKRFEQAPARRKCCWKVKSVRATDRVEDVYCAVVPGTHEFVLEDNILVGNCLALRAHDSREGWSELVGKSCKALMTGAGVGVVYSDVRHEGALIRKTGGTASGPLPLIQMINECGRGVMQGGVRRSAIWAGLHWNHPDIHKFIRIKNWPDEIKALKAKDYSFPGPLDHTNISTILDDDFFAAYEDDEDPEHPLAHSVYWAVIEQMLRTGEPAFTVDVGKNAGENNRNACCELTTRDTDDICNLGSLNLGAIDDIEELKYLVEISTAFLLAGSVYTDVPYSDVDKVLSKNRRLGLGLMGIHEWLLKRGKVYGPDEELGIWLKAYSRSGKYANSYADEWGLKRPKKTRAIAPNGTTGIVAETTGGIEPIFCVAYKRAYLKGTQQHYQYVVDPVAKRLIAGGIDPAAIEDAYDLAQNVERRVAFQAWVQQYVDHAISSTINLPAWGSEHNNKDTVRAFGSMLFRYLPQLRGITTYPDGSRGGQPLTPVTYMEAVGQEGIELIEEQKNVCSLTGGSCGD